MTNAYAKLIAAEESLLLVIDLQEKFVPFLKHPKRVMQSAEILLQAAATLGMPVLVTEHHPEAIGPTLPPVADLISGAEKFRKDIFSCLGDERISSHTRRLPLLVRVDQYGALRVQYADAGFELRTEPERGVGQIGQIRPLQECLPRWGDDILSL